jgi:hypothetical protein
LQQPGSRHHHALSLWSYFIQAAAGVVLALSALLMLAPPLGETFFYLVYLQQPASPVPVPAEVLGSPAV